LWALLYEKEKEANIKHKKASFHCLSLPSKAQHFLSQYLSVYCTDIDNHTHTHTHKHTPAKKLCSAALVAFVVFLFAAL